MVATLLLIRAPPFVLFVLLQRYVRIGLTTGSIKGQRGKDEETMQRVAFLLELKPEASPAEYKRRHDQIWPEMSATLREAGMRNYSIFRNGTQLFAYCEVDDWQQTLRRLDASDVNKRWQEHMSDILEIPIDPATGSFYVLEEMFHHD